MDNNLQQAIPGRICTNHIITVVDLIKHHYHILIFFFETSKNLQPKSNSKNKDIEREGL